MSKERLRILLAEDDLNLGVLLVDYLEGENFQVKLCKNGELAIRAFESNPFDICLLDVMMPVLDGFEVAKRIRDQDKKVPILFITARSLKADKLKGYGLGADDYITKPFDEEELLWKIQALIRRLPDPSETAVAEVIKVGKFEFDFLNQSLSIDGRSKRITEKESQILKYLFQQKNNVVKREELLKDLWGENDYFFGRSLDVFITKIRKYLKDDPELCIENVFGVGFILKAP